MKLRHLLSPRRWRAFATKPPAFPDGHFYSPAVDPDELGAQAGELWPNDPPDTPGITWDEAAHRELLARAGEIAAEYDYAQKASPNGFRDPNGIFEGLDSRMLYAMLRLYGPKKMIEVGSGMSTLLAAETNRRHLDGAMEFTAVEPYPQEFLQKQLHGLSGLVVKKAQEVPVDTFTALGEGDVLFIDSSHVAKTGSDVNYLYHQVLPRLRPGMIVHVHDIFLPWDYPEQWVRHERRNWNEQYLLQSMLAASKRFEILFANHYASRVLPDAVEACWGLRCGGGSIWLRTI